MVLFIEREGGERGEVFGICRWGCIRGAVEGEKEGDDGGLPDGGGEV